MLIDAASSRSGSDVIIKIVGPSKSGKTTLTSELVNSIDKWIQSNGRSAKIKYMQTVGKMTASGTKAQESTLCPLTGETNKLGDGDNWVSDLSWSRCSSDTISRLKPEATLEVRAQRVLVLVSLLLPSVLYEPVLYDPSL